MGLGAIGIIGTLASTGLQIYGQHQQAKSAQQAAEYNNSLALAEAANKEAETRQATERARINDRADLADLRTHLSGNIATGTPLLILGQAAGAQELAIQDAARNSTIQADGLRQQGKMGLWEAEQTGQAAKLQMIGTGLQGLSSAFGQYKEGATLGMYPRIGGR